MTTCDKIVILFFINIYGFHLILRSQLRTPHASLQECYSVKMSAGAALRRALMAMCMMWIPYADSDRNFPPLRFGAAPHCMYLRRIIQAQKPTSRLPLYGSDLLSLSSVPQEVEHNSVWSKNLNESFCSLRDLQPSGESHSLIGFSTFRSNPL